MNDRKRMAEALIDLCYEHGYRSTTLEMLLERAGVDRAAFERHYADMEDCFCQVYEEVQGELVKRIQGAIEREPSWRDRLRATAYTMADFVAEDEKRTHFTIYEVRAAGDRAVYLLGESYERLFDLIDLGRRERSFRRSISRATAEAIGGTIFFQMYASFEAGSVESVRAKVPEMMYVAVLPYLGAEAAEEELRLVPQQR
jgi:AcrR family transcriptional regulator